MRLFALFFYLISFMVPKQKKRWVFGEAYGYNNNSKYLYLDIIANHPEIEAYWIGKSSIVNQLQKRKLPAHKRFSLQGIWLCLTASTYIVSSTPGDINFYTSGNAIIINLWHGVGWKACLWTNPIHQIYKEKSLLANIGHCITYPHLYFKPTKILSTSPEMSKLFFAPMFDIPQSHCIEALYPRCQFMLQKKERIKSYIT